MKTILTTVAVIGAMLSAAPAFALVTADTYEGTLHTYCMNGAASCHAVLDVGDKTYTVNAPFKNFVGLDGATVRIHGDVGAACPGGGDCAALHTITMTSKNIDVYGRIGMLMRSTNPTIPHAGNYLLQWGKGQNKHSIVVDYRGNAMGDDGEMVWVTGRVHAGGGDLAPFFVAKEIGRFQNYAGLGSDAGNNAGRDANTTPVAQSSSSSSGSSMGGAGVAH